MVSRTVQRPLSPPREKELHPPPHPCASPSQSTNLTRPFHKVPAISSSRPLLSSEINPTLRTSQSLLQVPGLVAQHQKVKYSRHCYESSAQVRGEAEARLILTSYLMSSGSWEAEGLKRQGLCLWLDSMGQKGMAGFQRP